ncbi:MAG: biopolymer transporter ExbD [Akkermansia sp.]
MAKKNMRPNDEVDGAVDMSPMIDCCFLLLIFFVVNATAITVSKDPNVRMPSAVSSSDLKDAKGCIVVNIFNDSDKMPPKVQAKFLESYPTPGIWWSTAGDADTGAKSRGYVPDETQALTDYISKQKELMLQRGIEEAQVRIYLRGDSDAPWERTAGAIRCGAAAGVTNIVFGTLPSK